MRKLSALIFSIFTLISMILFAHGEDKPGPNGGYLKMPSNFHTEVVKEKSGYRIYLLDINWKNPSVVDSSLKATVQVGDKKTILTCTKETNSYFCKSTLNENGKLLIAAKREGQTGTVAHYDLPLRFEKAKPEAITGHEGHH